MAKSRAKQRFSAGDDDQEVTFWTGKEIISQPMHLLFASEVEPLVMDEYEYVTITDCSVTVERLTYEQVDAVRELLNGKKVLNGTKTLVEKI